MDSAYSRSDTPKHLARRSRKVSGANDLNLAVLVSPISPDEPHGTRHAAESVVWKSIPDESYVFSALRPRRACRILSHGVSRHKTSSISSAFSSRPPDLRHEESIPYKAGRASKGADISRLSHLHISTMRFSEDDGVAESFPFLCSLIEDFDADLPTTDDPPRALGMMRPDSTAAAASDAPSSSHPIPAECLTSLLETCEKRLLPPPSSSGIVSPSRTALRKASVCSHSGEASTTEQPAAASAVVFVPDRSNLGPRMGGPSMSPMDPPLDTRRSSRDPARSVASVARIADRIDATPSTDETGGMRRMPLSLGGLPCHLLDLGPSTLRRGGLARRRGAN
mmetsp:Transcript_11652/g.27385  ORF Transcript_11652/g.27385 Transcript_11652/m.27385 type:complete len:338 (-) Transcript_11652:313-1326(-)